MSKDTKTIVNIGNIAFTFERREGDPLSLTVMVGDTAALLPTYLTDQQVAQLVEALQPRDQCPCRWRQGIISPPEGNIPHGARCLLGKHDENTPHKFRNEYGEVVDRGKEYKRGS